MNLFDLLAATAARQGDAPALIGPGMAPGSGADALSYAALVRRIETLADRLRALGIKRGACIALLLPNGAGYIVATYALWRCGACVVPIGTELAAAERAQVLRGIRVEALLCEQAAAAAMLPGADGAGSELPRGLMLRRLQPSRAHPAGFDEIDAAFIRFTSGTTGAAKGVVLSHQAVHERIVAANAALGIGPSDRVLWLLSMAYHFTVSIVSYLTFGAAIVQCRNHLGATLAAAAQAEGATVIYGSPIHYELLAAAARGPLPRLRVALSTTAALRDEVARAFHARFGIGLGQAYGIIEIGLPCINLGAAGERSDGVGRVLPAYQVDLADEGWGEGLRRIRFRGPGMFDAYYDPWTPRAAVAPDGWFDTGDLGHRDAQGCIRLLGRAKEVINVAGMKLFPQETEAVLEAHPDVLEACVYRHADQRLGEVPHARVVLKPGAIATESELRDACARQLALYKVPARIELAAALARTPSGKRIRDEARQTMAEGAVHG